MSGNQITYPYMPRNRFFVYVDIDDPFINSAKKFARENSLDDTMPNASVLVRDGRIIKMTANGSDYHKKNPCQRIALNIPTGQGYELCEGCHPKNHSEGKLIRQVLSENEDVIGSDLYLWGHWWCCEPCWDEIERAKISKVHLLRDSHILFNKNHPDNIVGRQFEV